MKRSTALPELLAPAGGVEALYAAVSAGADAVYLGGRFNARAFAKNFDDEALSSAVSYAHLHGVKVYVTLNTLVYDKELSELLSYAKTVRDTGADAVIVADLGVMKLLRTHVPDLPIHASTQSFVHNQETADFYTERGALRVVAAREMGLPDIKTLVDTAKAEVEVFLHGALCVCHSGQCLFSSLVGGRSGNRGECAQPCRLPYNGGYPLSLKDLSLADHIPSLIESGVASLKIEGRMKSPSYVYGVTSIYRRLLDEGRAATDEEKERLSALFCRGGFTDRYYTGKIREKMIGTRSDEDKERSRAAESDTPFLPTRLFVKGEATVVKDRPATLTLIGRGRHVTVTGDTPLIATGAPLTEETVKKQLCKMGGSFLSLAEADLSLTLEEGLFLPMGALNALRRRAVDAFCDTARPPIEAPLYKKAPLEKSRELPRRTVLCHRAEQVRPIRASSLFDAIFYPLLDGEFDALPTPDGVALPPVFMPSELDAVKEALQKARDKGAKYALCPQMGAISLAKEAGLIPLGDFRLNITNRESLAEVMRAGARDAILSPEMGLGAIAALRAGRVLTYGRIPLMVTERCFIRENGGCQTCNEAALLDRRRVEFPMMRVYPHRNYILNSVPTYMGDRAEVLRSSGVLSEHYLFTVENEKECEAVLFAAKRGLPLLEAVRRIGK